MKRRQKEGETGRKGGREVVQEGGGEMEPRRSTEEVLRGRSGGEEALMCSEMETKKW